MAPTDAIVEPQTPRATGAQGPSAQVTVVVPARNEEHVLPHTLPSLLDAAGQLPAPSDIVVVTPASSPLAVDPPLEHERLRWWKVTDPGKYQAVQAGVSTTDAEIVLLVDADVLVEPTALLRLAEPRRARRRLRWSRRAGTAHRGIRQAVLARWATVSFEAWDLMRRERPDLRWALPGAAYAIRRSFLPESPLVPLIDDASVGLHAQEAGARFAYEPDAVVRSPAQDTYAMWARQKLRSRRGWAALAEHRPQEVAVLEAAFRPYLSVAASGERTRRLMYTQDRLLRAVARRLGVPTSGAWVPSRTEKQWNR